MQQIKTTQILKNKKGKPKDALQYENLFYNIIHFFFLLMGYHITWDW